MVLCLLVLSLMTAKSNPSSSVGPSVSLDQDYVDIDKVWQKSVIDLYMDVSFRLYFYLGSETSTSGTSKCTDDGMTLMDVSDGLLPIPFSCNFKRTSSTR